MTQHVDSPGPAPTYSQPPSAKVERRSRHDSKHSVSHSVKSTVSHQDYLESLQVPTPDMIEHIAAVQERKEEEGRMHRLLSTGQDLTHEERHRAAALIQRNYRGYRERRQLQGLALDPTTRWVEAVREAKYRNLTQPRARVSVDRTDQRRTSISARQNWKKIGTIARRAGGDEDSEDELSVEDNADLTEEQQRQRDEHRAEQRASRRKAAKMMDLQYFLEMVDLKHRYGSNLRKFHQVWQKADTNENFFYWLDYGEGRFMDVVGCPRSRLDREQVRYLSREERLNYLVKIDDEGRLCYAKNGERINTTESFKDSLLGIVPDDDPTPAYIPARAETTTGFRDRPSTSTVSSSAIDDEEEEAARADKYANHDLDKSKGMKKVVHFSTTDIFNQLLRSSVRKNTWIFVADTSFRLYVGLKQSGAFQHSSFLHGSRISAAGLIKIKNGRLSKLSPLSGHYRPPVSNFKAFVHNLQDSGVDMSHVSISRSYALLVGLEAYMRTRKRGKRVVQSLIHRRDKLLSPEKVKKQELAEMDNSKSAARERKHIEALGGEEKAEADGNSTSVKLMRKLGLSDEPPKHKGEGPEDGIPAPEGTRKVTAENDC